MAIGSTKALNLKRIQRELNILPKYFENLLIDETELQKIYEDYQLSLVTLDGIKAEILSILNEKLSDKVHSIRCRIKEPDHLIEKIIRNIHCKPDKYAGINVDNYNKIITDLIGVRIIILNKRDWLEVHKSLLKIFRNLPKRYVKTPEDIILNYDRFQKDAEEPEKALERSYHAEMPKVYITSEDDRELYQHKYLDVDTSKTHYRSIHYIIRYKFVYFEIQVRTLFEEGWLEFDHRIKYPYDQNNKKKQEYVEVLSSLAIAADRLISFYDEVDFKQETESDKNSSKGDNRSGLSETGGESLEDKMTILF